MPRPQYNLDDPNVNQVSEMQTREMLGNLDRKLDSIQESVDSQQNSGGGNVPEKDNSSDLLTKILDSLKRIEELISSQSKGKSPEGGFAGMDEHFKKFGQDIDKLGKYLTEISHPKEIASGASNLETVQLEPPKAALTQIMPPDMLMKDNLLPTSEDETVEKLVKETTIENNNVIEKDTNKTDDIKELTETLKNSNKNTSVQESNNKPDMIGQAIKLVEENPEVLALNSGGYTTAKKGIVGDNPDGSINDTSEMFINPTGAPIGIIPNKDLTKNAHRFSMGTDFDLTEIPHFPSGTTGGQIGSAISSGGSTTNPNQLVGAASQGFQTATNALLPEEIAEPINKVATFFEYLAHVTIDVIEGFNKLAENVGRYSGNIVQAQAEVEIAQLRLDLETAEKMGPQLAELYKDSNMIWIDIQRMLRSLSEPLLAVLVPVVHEVRGFIEHSTFSFRKFEVLSEIIEGTIARFAMLNFTDFSQWLREKLDELIKNTSDKQTIEFNENLGLSALTAANRANSINVGIP